MNYSVQQGDTMYGIAKRYGLKFAELVSLNPQVTDPDLIYPGQVIQVPGNEKEETGKTSDPSKVLEVAAKLDELVKELGDFPGLSGKRLSSTKTGYPKGRIPGPRARRMPKYPPAMMTGYLRGTMPGFAPAVMNADHGGTPPGQYPEPSPKSRTEGKSQQRMEIRFLQQRLIELGYYNGSITGRIGTKTKAAINKLQKDFGRPANGVVDRFVWEIIGRH